MHVATRLLEGAAYVATIAYTSTLVVVLVKRGWSDPLVEMLEARFGELLLIAAVAATAGGTIASRGFADMALLAGTFAVSAVALCSVGAARDRPGEVSGGRRHAAFVVASLPLVVALG